MEILRPITLDDLEQLVELTSMAGHGLTSLPNDAELLHRRVRDSVRDFSRSDEAPQGQSYLFVLEDLSTGRIVGTSGVVSKVGGFEPFYAYRMQMSHHKSAVLKVQKEVQALHLVAEHNGPSEIGSLFLAPDKRRGGNGRLLSLGRFLYIAEHAQRFEPTVIAEMRGVIDAEGGSVFWDALGRHFFDVDFPVVDYMSAVDKRFIADLMPKHPIYIPLLPPAAQEVIGQVHQNTCPALRLLLEQGFCDSGMVDIFEAGPVLTVQRDQIATVQQSRRVKVTEISDSEFGSADHLIAAVQDGFRVSAGPLAATELGVRLWARTALALGIKVGQCVRVAPLRPDTGSNQVQSH